MPRRNALKIETQQGRSAVEELARAVSRWSTVVAHHRPVDPEVYRGANGVADDVIVGAERLLSLVHEDETLVNLPLAAEIRDTLTPLLEGARKESQEADSLARETQALERTVRELAVEVYDALKRFRVLLRGHLGATHRDYRSLRVRRARGEVDTDEAQDTDEADVVDDDGAPLESSVTAAAPPPAPADAPRTDPPESNVDRDELEGPESEVA
jgi:hypothetical protein